MCFIVHNNRTLFVFFQGMLIAFLSLLLFSACSSQEEDKSVGTGSEKTDIPDKQSELVLYNWEDYIGESTLDDFEKHTGIKVRLITYEDDEEVISGIQSGAMTPDLVVVSESVAMEMIKARLLTQLDRDIMPNLDHVDDSALGKGIERSPEIKKYMASYFVGTTGMMVNKEYIPDNYHTWNVLWDESYRGRIAMLNNPFEVAGTASKLLGFPLNPRPEQLPNIRDKLMEQKPLLTGYFDAITLVDMMVNEQIWAAQIYSGDGLMAAELNSNVAFIIPEEGCAIWHDVFVIPQEAENIDEAYQFINFIHQPRVNARITSEMWCMTLNTAAREYIDPEVLDSPYVFPPENKLANCEFFGDMGEEESVRGRLQIWSDLITD